MACEAEISYMDKLARYEAGERASSGPSWEDAHSLIYRSGQIEDLNRGEE